MPRQARLDAPGAMHHIMVRGINKSAIFKKSQDKQLFLERMGKDVIKGQCMVYAWVFMDNHAHILLKSGKEGISTVMRRLLTWYAKYFNRRHQRTGHVFENRYKSILCEEEQYLLSLIRYIHLNPLRAKIVNSMEELDSYPWSGHQAILGKSKYSWMAIDEVWANFASKCQKAIYEYRAFMNTDKEMESDNVLTGGGLIRSCGGWSQVVAMRRRGEKEEGDERILGSGEFVQAILKESEERHRRQLKIKTSGRNIEEILREECVKRCINEVEIKKGIRRIEVSEARAVIAKRGREELGLTGAEMARHMGVNTSSINRAIISERKK